ncbi:MAG TPA: polysaccharide biosynthesis protein [Clostridia bacterium]|nr:polysaccharide biosynthesis protein [Clostridia bacterium]
MTKQSFLKGALILLLASVLVKFLGFLYQILIIRLISPEGIGIFNLVFPLYVTALVLTTAGLPLAVSKFVAAEVAAENYQQAEKIFGTALTLLFIFATIITFFFILMAPKLINFLYTDPRVLPAFLFLLPTLLLVSIASVIKGFFQGLQDMRPTALSQLIEQTVRISSGLLLIYLLRPYGLTWTAVGLSIAIFLSELSGLIYLVTLYKNKISRQLFHKPSLAIIKQLFSFGIPITITRIISSTVVALESSLIPRQLKKAGRTLSEATSFYGELSGVAFTILAIPSTLTFSLATTLVPAISEAQSKQQKQLLSRRTSEAIGITIIAGMPCGLILFYWGPLITKLLFNVTQAGELLKILALGSIFLYLLQTTTGILQGLGCVKTIIFTTLIGGIIKLFGIYIGGGHPFGGPSRIALSYVASYFTVSLLNLFIIKRKTSLKLQPGFFLRLILASILLSFALTYGYDFVSQNVLCLILLAPSLALLFLLILFMTGDKYSHLILTHLFQKISKGSL